MVALAIAISIYAALIFGILFILSLLFYRLVFLRDPERDIPIGSNVVAPADGEIIKLLNLGNLSEIKVEKGVLGRIRAMVPEACKNGHLVTIMMNIFNVHVQRAPVEGRVTSIKHSIGSFKNAVYGDKFENGLINEKNEIIIENEKIGEIKVIQIAGFLARRIECFVKEKQKINKGERIGVIKLGSQVCLILPERVKLLINAGDRVRAGETIIGRYQGRL